MPTSFSQLGVNPGFKLSSAHLSLRPGLITHNNRHTLFHEVVLSRWLILLVDCFLGGLHQLKQEPSENQ